MVNVWGFVPLFHRGGQPSQSHWFAVGFLYPSVTLERRCPNEVGSSRFCRFATSNERPKGHKHPCVYYCLFVFVGVCFVFTKSPQSVELQKFF